MYRRGAGGGSRGDELVLIAALPEDHVVGAERVADVLEVPLDDLGLHRVLGDRAVGRRHAAEARRAHGAHAAAGSGTQREGKCGVLRRRTLGLFARATCDDQCCKERREKRGKRGAQGERGRWHVGPQSSSS